MGQMQGCSAGSGDLVMLDDANTNIRHKDTYRALPQQLECERGRHRTGHDVVLKIVACFRRDGEVTWGPFA